MSKIVIGAYAHVDAGKTTLSEAILHHCGALRSFGRVDHEDSFLDYNEYERRKGITVLAKQARFSYKDKEYIYVDTPGHLDFAGEVNRTFAILDLAILIVDAGSNVPADTMKRFRYLKTLGIPVFIFANKMDIAHDLKETIVARLRRQLSSEVCPNEEVPENCALNHEEVLDDYLQHGTIDSSYISEDLKQGRIFPLFFGSALHEEGVEELLEAIDRYIVIDETSSRFKAYIYKVDEYAHLKIFSGTLHNRDSFGEHKISQIVRFNGSRIEAVNEVKGPDLCAVKGLNGLKAGTFLPSLFLEEQTPLNTLTYALTGSLDDNELYRRLSPLNDEFPELNIRLEKGVTIDLIGELHKDFIIDLIAKRYGITVALSKPLISYAETIEAPVYGVGHYEPLRHYAEVLVALSPASSYKVKSRKEYQVLIDHLKTYRPRGLLTCSPLDNIEIEILETRTHLKHTEGGDLQSALDRAVRQALTKAVSILLEPYYLVSFSADKAIMSGIISDLSAQRFLFDVEEEALIAKVPIRLYNDLILSLRNRFKDDFSCAIDGTVYDRCHDEQQIVASFGYDYTADTLRPCGSIFTRNGAGTYVPPEEVEEVMHIDLKQHFADYTPPVRHYQRTINEEELKRVWNSLYKPRPRYIERNSESSSSARQEYKPAKELVYLIDGYNVMHAMEDVPLDNLPIAREKVIDLVCDFAGYISAQCILIFDAYLQDASKASLSQRDNITIVYTKTGQTADMYIEAKAKQMDDEYRLIVVTSDALEQLSIFSSDALRLSSREFLARYQNFRKNMTHIEKVSNRPLARLRDLLYD